MLRNWHAHYFKEVSSTMDVGHDLILKKNICPSDGLVILAETQTAGRGRRQRRWSSPEGNFYGSFVILPQLTESNYPLYTFAVVMALFDTISEIIGHDYFLNVKWPNDLLLNGKKIAGILLELSHTQPKHLIVGIGVNLASAPFDSIYPATNVLGESQTCILAKDFMLYLLPHLTSTLDLIETKGFEPIRQAWLQARYPQEELCVRGMHANLEKEIKGTFVDLDCEGKLVLQEPHTNQLISIACGDVFL
jgi:BirA family biotin operon repressor/biotin-[acetyl-CoA-carboxylase] ligase